MLVKYLLDFYKKILYFNCYIQNVGKIIGPTHIYNKSQSNMAIETRMPENDSNKTLNSLCQWILLRLWLLQTETDYVSNCYSTCNYYKQEQVLSENVTHLVIIVNTTTKLVIMSKLFSEYFWEQYYENRLDWFSCKKIIYKPPSSGRRRIALFPSPLLLDNKCKKSKKSDIESLLLYIQYCNIKKKWLWVLYLS